jgi:hypothetical protein
MGTSELLQLWQETGARRWVEMHGGVWDHADWLGLKEDLRRQGLWGADFDQVAGILERCKVEFWNLRRWRDSGEAWRWVEAHRGEWAHHDWMTLLSGLQCWLGPLGPASVGQALETLKRQYWALERWKASGAAARWVEEHNGHWEHHDWLGLLAALEQSEYGALVPEAVARVLEQCKRAYWNLRHWESSGEPYRWVEACRGRWNHADWLRLLAGLERSEFWPLSPEAVGGVLERTRRRYVGLERWQRSGAARLWVAMRGGQWREADLLDLLALLERTERIEVDPLALGELLERLKEEYVNLRRWLKKVPEVVRKGSALTTDEGALLVSGQWQHGAWREGEGRRAA